MLFNHSRIKAMFPCVVPCLQWSVPKPCQLMTHLSCPIRSLPRESWRSLEMKSVKALTTRASWPARTPAPWSSSRRPWNGENTCDWFSRVCGPHVPLCVCLCVSAEGELRLTTCLLCYSATMQKKKSNLLIKRKNHKEFTHNYIHELSALISSLNAPWLDAISLLVLFIFVFLLLTTQRWDEEVTVSMFVCSLC